MPDRARAWVRIGADARGVYGRGFEVLGLDRSPAMLGLARRRLSAAGLRADVVPADLAPLDLDRRFDGAVCLVNTLGRSRTSSR
jgi:ubiquinone/menaquinone biosynthesis C-methylase UbiE